MLLCNQLVLVTSFFLIQIVGYVMTVYNVSSYVGQIFGPKGRFGSVIGDHDVAKAISDEIDLLLQMQFLVSTASSLYRKIPLGRFSAVLLPGLFPEKPLSDVVDLVSMLRSPWLVVGGHHLGYDDVSGIKSVVSIGTRTHEYFGEKSVGHHLAKVGMHDTNFVTQGGALHTADHADWVAGQIRDNRIEAVVVMASAAHLPRAFCTLVQSLIKINVWVPVVPIPHLLNPLEKITPNTSNEADRSEDEANAFSQLTYSRAEPERVLTYLRQEIPDVVSLEDLKVFVSWMYEHPLLNVTHLMSK